MTEEQFFKFLDQHGVNKNKLMVIMSMGELFEFVDAVETYVLKDIIRFEDSSEAVPSSFIRAKLKRDEH
jgi:hypothetical protein